MKILFACKEFPHARVIGGPVIIYNRLKYLSQNHVVSLAAFCREEEKEYIPSVKEYCHDLRLVPFPPKRSLLRTAYDFFTSPVPHYFLRFHKSPQMSETIAEMVRKDCYDFVIAEYSVMGQFIHKNRLLPPVRRVMSVHECYYLARLKDYRHHRVGLNKMREAINMKGLKRYEFAMYQQADKVLTLTPQGKGELLEISSDLDIEVVPHGVDIEKFIFSDFDYDKKNIVFVGNYLHHPNTDAVLYFYEEIWPKLREMVPGLTFSIVGQGPPPEIQKMSQDERIVVTGRVDDVVPYLREGLVFICPVRLGGGFRGKILEAMAVGRPIVSTPLGADGVPAENRENIVLADSPEDFARGIFDLLNDTSFYQKVRMNARKLVEEKYAWAQGVKVLEEILDKMMRKSPSEQNH